ncbi:MAG: asparagine synthase (glutamine-hydrolyzing) [Candidatus Promineifilaceae bacterium]
MCGIVGILGPDVAEARLRRAATLLAHRGPDDEGIVCRPGAGLAARRLSIIDLTGGHQPLSTADGKLWIVYNGEVYNAPQLRQRLQTAGHRFRTLSDTEVVLQAYAEWGDAAVPRLDGMFAFAIWDEPRRRMLLARDRFGIKPLYYAQLGPTLAFASEIRPLLAALPDLSVRLEPAALDQLLQWGFVPTPLTFFAGVLKLPAAHTLVVQHGRLAFRRYWELEYPRPGKHRDIPFEAAAEEFLARLRKSVAAWRLSDVEVGSLLSGGLDSSTLAALLTEAGGRPIHTFHIAFSDPSHDETAQARQVARHLGSQHHDLAFGAEAFDCLPHIVSLLEEPQCSATSIPLYLLYRSCHQAGFKVILTGEGADELLGGYHWFEGDRRLRPFLGWPRPLRQLMARLAPGASAAGRRVLVSGRLDAAGRYADWLRLAERPAIRVLLAPDLRAHLDAGAGPLLPEPAWSVAAANGHHPLDQFTFLEARSRLPDFINFEVDRMSMASSVEARPPYLDHDLWEFCARLPPQHKLSGAGTKRLLRAAAGSLLPPAIAGRPKQGLATPHAAWWRRPRLPDWAEAALEPAALAAGGLFDPAAVGRLRLSHRQGRLDHSRLLMGVLTSQLWQQEFSAAPAG